MLIPTTKAAEILKVNSTQAVVQLARRHKKDLPMMNVGSEDQPRWVLRKGDVRAFQAKREAGEIQEDAQDDIS